MTRKNVVDFSAHSDPFLPLEFFAKEFNCSAKHLSNVSLQQRGRLKEPMFSQRAIARYPVFVKGPKGAVGMYASQYRTWRERQIEQQEQLGREAS